MYNSVFVKICGLTNEEDLRNILPYFPDAIGFILVPNSKRQVSTSVANALSKELNKMALHKRILSVVVVVDMSVETVESVFFETGADVIQLHGNESPEYCIELKKKFPKKQIWKAFRIEKQEDLEIVSQYEMCDRLLFDAFSREANGGTGKQIDSFLLPKIRCVSPPHVPFLIAGGINAENFSHALSISGASGIDLSSSLEEYPGKKSGQKVKDFFFAFQKYVA
jgi:phosphoribosylanthranilate isomerase